MKIAFTERIITPAIGTCLAGYGPHDVSVAKMDDLYMSMLAMDNGTDKCLIIGFDLIGMDDRYIRQIREACAKVLGVRKTHVILSCTHTHEGPHTRSQQGRDILEKEYTENLVKTAIAATEELAKGEWIDTNMYVYSSTCNANMNRRIITNDNRCTFHPHRPDLTPLATGFCDQEMGLLVFRRKANPGDIVYLVGNYAAHPLAAHAPGLGSFRISADYPGLFRNMIRCDVGCSCMFLTGAAGDMFPKRSETGIPAMVAIATALAQNAMEGIIAATRNPNSYLVKDETIHSCMKSPTLNIRAHRREALPPDHQNDEKLKLDMQMLSIGPVCLVGVPGELLAELGQEIKWHSPYRKTFILYGSTAYLDYLCHGNALVQGGYEGGAQLCDSRSGLALVQAAVDGMYKLYEETYPDKEQWPENQKANLVNIINTPWN